MQQPQVVFQQDMAKAVEADLGGSFISESCVAKGKISYAKWTSSQSQGSQAAFLEFGFEDENGMKANYLSLCYKKSDGQLNKIGDAQIHAVMACAGVQQLTAVNTEAGHICPELTDKPIALALERVNYYKGDGSEGYKMEIKAIMRGDTMQTVKEQQTQHKPEHKDIWIKRFQASPTGNQLAPRQNNNAGYDQDQMPDVGF